MSPSFGTQHASSSPRERPENALPTRKQDLRHATNNRSLRTISFRQLAPRKGQTTHRHATKARSRQLTAANGQSPAAGPRERPDDAPTRNKGTQPITDRRKRSVTGSWPPRKARRRTDTQLKKKNRLSRKDSHWKLATANDQTTNDYRCRG
jgi:hypothetical protein